MLKIYYANSFNFRQKYNLDDLLKSIPARMHEKACRYKFPRDAFNYTLGRLMLKKGLQDLNKNIDLGQMQFLKNDKPYLDGVKFNISHSGDLVVCVIDNNIEAGIDVEMEKEIDLKGFSAWFTSKEWADIQQQENPQQRFYWYWTRKESIIKALGVNLDHLNKIELDAAGKHFVKNEKTWFLKDLSFWNGYAGAICTEVEIAEDLRPINFETF